MSVRQRGAELLRHPLLNKGTAFSRAERRAFGIEGLLPHGVSTMRQQAKRAWENICAKDDPLEKYIGLAALHDRNEHLYYRVLLEHFEEVLPLVYTPTVGLACQRFSHVFRRGRGIWITPDDRGRVAEALGSAPFEDVRLIVATDNERILGLGDLGAGGMGIPIGKLALYTAGAGVHPAQTLPVSLDVGTDNEALLADDLYLGVRSRRLRGEPYDALVDEFVGAVKQRFPGALLQWEDFKKATALRVLDRHRSSLPSFNDDVQGTAAVVVAALIASLGATGVPRVRQRLVHLGAGAAGAGIARLLRLVLARAGVAGNRLASAIACLDSRGLLCADREIAESYKRDLAWSPHLVAAHGLEAGPRDLEAVVRAVRPTMLVGTTGEPGTFTEAAVRAMAATTARPLILPLTNPSQCCEALPSDLLHWTDGRALIATGSPFPPSQHQGVEHQHSQANNAYIFPGVGLGVLVSGAREVLDVFFLAAAQHVAMEVQDVHLRAGRVLPPIADLRQLSFGIACAVVAAARDLGVGRSVADDDIPREVAQAMWEPVYPEFSPA